MSENSPYTFKDFHEKLKNVIKKYNFKDMDNLNNICVYVNKIAESSPRMLIQIFNHLYQANICVQTNIDEEMEYITVANILFGGEDIDHIETIMFNDPYKYFDVDHIESSTHHGGYDQSDVHNNEFPIDTPMSEFKWVKCFDKRYQKFIIEALASFVNKY